MEMVNGKGVVDQETVYQTTHSISLSKSVVHVLKGCPILFMMKRRVFFWNGGADCRQRFCVDLMDLVWALWGSLGGSASDSPNGTELLNYKTRWIRGLQHLRWQAEHTQTPWNKDNADQKFKFIMLLF